MQHHATIFRRLNNKQMATIKAEKRSPRVSFTIDELTVERQNLLAELHGQKEPSAELQRSAYEKGIEILIQEATNRVDGELARRQIEILKSVLSRLDAIEDQLKRSTRPEQA